MSATPMAPVLLVETVYFAVVGAWFIACSKADELLAGLPEILAADVLAST